MINLHAQSFLDITDFSSAEIIYLLDLSHSMKQGTYLGKEPTKIKGKRLALIFEKDSVRTRCSFEVAAADLGMMSTYLTSQNSHIGKKESIADTARVLGGLYDGIVYRGFSEKTLHLLKDYSGVPVYNALTDYSHPTQMLADAFTMKEYSHKPYSQISFTFVGDARFNMACSLLALGAVLGMDVRIVCPKSLEPHKEWVDKCQNIAQKTGAKIQITDNLAKGVYQTDFIHTDIWLSMGEDSSKWKERIELLQPYAITQEVLTMSQNPNVYFMHCLPAFHNRETSVGEDIYQKFGLEFMEVNEEVFESKHSIVFAQAENRLYTVKALLWATLS